MHRLPAVRALFTNLSYSRYSAVLSYHSKTGIYGYIPKEKGRHSTGSFMFFFLIGQLLEVWLEVCPHKILYITILVCMLSMEANRHLIALQYKNIYKNDHECSSMWNIAANILSQSFHEKLKFQRIVCRRDNRPTLRKTRYESECFYTPRNEVRGGILESPCPSVCPSVRLSVDARLGKMVSRA